jgi:hypothetical protein
MESYESPDLDDGQTDALAPAWIRDRVRRKFEALRRVGDIEELELVQATEPPLGIRAPGIALARLIDAVSRRGSSR